MSTQQSTDAKASRQEILDRIVDRVAELLEPKSTSETAWVRAHVECPDPVCAACDHPAGLHESGAPCSAERCGCSSLVREPLYAWETACVLCGQRIEPGQGQRLQPRSHNVEHPPLVDQLEHQVEGSTAGVSGSAAESRPAANLAAVDALGIMEREAAMWARFLVGDRSAPLLGERPPSDDLRNTLAELAKRAPELERSKLLALDFDVLTWWARARVVTTWDVEPIKVHVPCMSCERRGGVQVRFDPLTAVCLYCGAAWDQATIGILGEHIKLAMAQDPVRPGPPAPRWPAPAPWGEVGHGIDEWHCACHGARHFPAREAAACERASGWSQAVRA